MSKEGSKQDEVQCWESCQLSLWKDLDHFLEPNDNKNLRWNVNKLTRSYCNTKAKENSRKQKELKEKWVAVHPRTDLLILKSLGIGV